MRKGDKKQQQYSISLISAIAYDRVIANQFIEGNVDSVLFENFVYQALLSVRTDSQLKEKDVVVFMDNAKIHLHPVIMETARRMKAHVVFNCEYSPWLNPIEQIFMVLKRRIREKPAYRK